MIDFTDHRPALQLPLHLSLEPRSPRPGLCRIHASDRVPDPLERPHAHQRCLPGADLAEKENLHYVGVLSPGTPSHTHASKRCSNFRLECSSRAFAQAALRICWYSSVCSSIQHMALATVLA